MKNLYRSLSLLTFVPFYLMGGIFSGLGYNNEDVECFDDVPYNEKNYACSNTFNLDFSGNTIGSSKFSSPFEARSESLSYSGGDLTLSYSFFVNDYEALTTAIGYEWDRVNWKGNHYFNQTNYKRIHFDLDAVTYRLPNWIWRAGVSVSCDGDHWNLRDYALYKYNVWGRYSFPLEILPDLGLHLGIIGRMGIHQDWELPIFGIDFTYERWIVHLIYPIDLSIAYEWADCWFIDVSYRWWNKRYRLGEDEALTRGIFEYRNKGIEVGGYYQYQEYLYAGIHLGHTFNRGEIVIHDRNNVNQGHYRLKSSFYIGGELALSY